MATTAKKKTVTEASKKQTAVQQMKALESKMMGHEKNFLILADEIDNLKTIIQGLSKRLNAAISAGETEAGVSNSSVNDIIIQENVKELQGKVSFLIEQGVLEETDKDATSAVDTFVVGREIDSEGKIVNPRVQFAIGSLSKEIQGKLTGFKVGEKVRLREEDPELEIVEIYKIGSPSIEKNFEEEVAPESVEG